ncbi:MAG TPA: DUF5985 family protein [Polyangiaceae bacterium]|nr:DUF5985 family protein [Polyangiaceae bacterium]
MNEFLRGAEAMGFLVVAMYFVRFWRSSRDVLFLLFAIAFLLEATSHAALAVNADPLERRPLFYLPRLAAYLLIIAGIVSKNVGPRPPRG